MPPMLHPQADAVRPGPDRARPRLSDPAAPGPADHLSLIEVLSRFESLGNNCEFGIVQRSAGYDPPGLFRNVGFLDVEQIISAVSRNFEGMFDPGRYVFTAPEGWLDWRLDCQVFGFMFHTGVALTVRQGTPEWDKAVADMLPVFEFLKGKLQEDLSDGLKTFVFRSLQPVPDDAPRRLLDALRQHGPNRLLYVRQDPSEPTGTMRDRGHGLVEATLNRLSNENPPQIEFDTWERMARALLASDPALEPRPMPLEPARSPAPSAAAPSAATPSAAAPLLPPIPAPPPSVDTPPLMHPFGQTGATPDPGIAVSFDVEDLQPGTVVTAQTWIFLPSAFRFDQVDFICIGYPTEEAQLPYLSRLDGWQLVSVTVRVPAGQSRAVPALCVRGPRAGYFFSSGWSIRLGAAPAH